VSQDPNLIGMLLASAYDASCDVHPPARALWDDVRNFVTRDRLGYGPGRMAEVFPADWDVLYEAGLSPEQAVRLVVWNSALTDLLGELNFEPVQFHFDFDQAFVDGRTPSEAVAEALGLAAYSGPGRASGPVGGAR
jgi:hypothetical protein